MSRSAFAMVLLASLAASAQDAARDDSDTAAVVDQLVQLRLQVAAGESWRQDQAAQEAAQHAATLDALGILRRADARLAAGDSDGVDEDLLGAESALSGRTGLDVEAAREALARSDLYPARRYLAAALAERRVSR